MRISDWSSDVCSSDLDVARAFAQALEQPAAAGGVFNIASGQPRTIESVARDIGRAMGQEIEPSITGERRAGDIRHCLADIDLARSVQIGRASCRDRVCQYV